MSDNGNSKVLEEEALDRVTLSSGVVLKLKPIPPLLLDKLVNKSFPIPEPPMVEVKSFDAPEGRMEPNPHDPAYKAAVAAIRHRQSETMIDLALARGADVTLPEDDGWIADLAELGIDAGETYNQRRNAYLRYVLLETADDLNRTMLAVMALSGVRESDIAEAEARFRRNSAGPAADGLREDAAEVEHPLQT